MLDMTRKFLKNTKCAVVFELELMKNKDSELYLLEINPVCRPGLSRCGCRPEHSEAWVTGTWQEGETLKSYTVGKMFIRYSWDMIVDREEFEQISIYGEL